ncbi:MAG: hypothetical protein SPF58_06725 [Candidatus Cryptobacteroides sp.]|nr:hypothetical protein [Candidatus Cryptobacteroides sp.]
MANVSFLYSVLFVILTPKLLSDIMHENMIHVKKFLLVPMISGLLISLMSFAPARHHHRSSEVQDSSDVTVQDDSILPVIAWFSKRDTMTYWIHDGQWEVKGKDTVMTLGAAAKVMLTVKDSTKKGYDMEYTFLEFVSNDQIKSESQNIVGQATDILNDATVGTTIRFRTDQYGKIVKYYNLKGIRKQAKKVLTKAISKMSYADSLRAVGLDPDKLMSMIDSDKLVDGYTEEIELLFDYHGDQYEIGKTESHENATENEYASDTKTDIWLDPDTYEYGISSDVYFYIPREDIKVLTGNLIESFIDKESAKDVREGLDTEFDRQVTTDGVYNSYVRISYFYDGWPQEVVSQENISLGNIQKLKQKYIIWDYRSVGNSE